MALQIIKLSLDRLHSVLNYDENTGIFTWKAQLAYRAKAGSRAGTVIGDGYRQITIDCVRYYEHRLAWFYIHGEWPSLDIDHEDLDRGDNRLSNLREATESQNLANTRVRKNSLTGLKGVSKNRNKWEARIRYHGKTERLGRFDTPQAAHAAYAAAAQRLAGAFARAA